MTNAQEASIRRQVHARNRHGKHVPGDLSTAQIAKRVGVTVEEVRKIIHEINQRKPV